MNLIGKFIRVKTKTQEDVFGECLYQITGETQSDSKGNVKNKCILFGGSGSSARPGMIVFDDLSVIEKNINDGITTLVDESDAEKLIEHYKKQVDLGQAPRVGSGVEWDV